MARQAPPPPVTVLATANVDVGLVRSSVVARGAAQARNYFVRPGDTLGDVVNTVGVSVQALAEANHRSARSVLRPGTTLVVPL